MTDGEPPRYYALLGFDVVEITRVESLLEARGEAYKLATRKRLDVWSIWSVRRTDARLEVERGPAPPEGGK